MSAENLPDPIATEMTHLAQETYEEQIIRWMFGGGPTFEEGLFSSVTVADVVGASSPETREADRRTQDAIEARRHQLRLAREPNRFPYAKKQEPSS